MRPITARSQRWPMRVAGLHSFVPPPPARAATTMLHLRSVPSPVALGGDDYASVSIRRSVHRHRPLFDQ